MKKSTFAKILALALCVVVMFAFAACGKKAEKEKYIIGTEPTFPPFDTTDENGEVDGFDRDVMEAIAEDQGYEIEYMTMDFQSLIPAIQAGNIDIIAAGMNAAPERREKVDFTETYYDSGLVVMVKIDNTTINGEQDLTPSMKVASQTGTTGAEEAQRLKDEGLIAEAVILDGFDTCVLQLQNGDVQAVIIDMPVANAYMKQHPDVFKTVGDVINAESFGFAVKKDNKELLDKLNKGLQNIVKSGKYQEICDKWEVYNKFAE